MNLMRCREPGGIVFRDCAGKNDRGLSCFHRFELSQAPLARPDASVFKQCGVNANIPPCVCGVGETKPSQGTVRVRWATMNCLTAEFRFQ